MSEALQGSSRKPEAPSPKTPLPALVWRQLTMHKAKPFSKAAELAAAEAGKGDREPLTEPSSEHRRGWTFSKGGQSLPSYSQ